MRRPDVVSSPWDRKSLDAFNKALEAALSNRFDPITDVNDFLRGLQGVATQYFGPKVGNSVTKTVRNQLKQQLPKMASKSSRKR